MDCQINFGSKNKSTCIYSEFAQVWNYDRSIYLHGARKSILRIRTDVQYSMEMAPLMQGARIQYSTVGLYSTVDQDIAYGFR